MGRGRGVHVGNLGNVGVLSSNNALRQQWRMGEAPGTQGPQSAF